VTDAAPASELQVDPDAPTTTASPSPSAPIARSRRSVIAGALGGVAGLVAARLSQPSPAAAAAGDPLIVGSQTNNSGTSDTQLIANSNVVTFKLYQQGPGTALMGYTTTATGTTRGVYGRVDSPSGDGLQGRNAGAAGTGAGIRAYGVNNQGVNATTDSGTKSAIYAEATAVADATSDEFTSRGVSGYAHGDGAVAFIFPNPSAGIYGFQDYAGTSGGNTAGVWGESTNSSGGAAVRALQWGSGYGINAFSGTGDAGNFSGNVTITGDLDVSGTVSKGGGSFRVDHPQDPANRYLVHSFVESPDMLNVYSGNVTTNGAGVATVKLPAYFGLVNKDLRYQLTTIGAQAQAWVQSEVKDGLFQVATDKANTKVSWQVTAVRADPWANANRIEVEVDKPAADKGTYLHPELYGQPEEKGRRYDPARTALKTYGIGKLKEVRQSMG